MVAPLMPQMVACFKALLAPPCWPWNAYKRDIIIWEQWEGWESEVNVRIERKSELQWQQPCCHCSSCKRAGSWVWVKWSSSSIYVVILSLYISNNIDSPVDVGGFAEPRKILCQCALLSVEQLLVHPRSAHGGAGIPQQKTIYNNM